MTNQKLSFIFFLSAVVAIGVYFFKIVQPFLLPLLMAGTLAMLIQPVFAWVTAHVQGHRRLAAILVSIAVVLLVVLPMGVILSFATQELVRFGEEIVDDANAPDIGAVVASPSSDDINDDVGTAHRTDAAIPESIPRLNGVERWLSPYLSRSNLEDLRSSIFDVGRAAVTEVSKKTTGFVADIVSFTIGFGVMILGFYYFLAEGPTIAAEIEKVLPFESADEVAVAKQFETICRGVVLGTLAAALVQAALVGVALAVLQISGTWLLVCLTVVFSMIPFVGAGAVYVPVSLYLLWDGRTAAAVFLLLYGMLLVSTADNLVRAYTIHGTSRLHPLVGLVSALGAIKLVGLWGIFVGPVVAGIFHALLKILQQKLRRWDGNSPTHSPMRPIPLSDAK